MDGILDSYRDVDITDKMLLEEQINYVRNQYFNALEAWEEVSKEISSLKGEISDIMTSYYSNIKLKSSEVNRALKGDEEYMEKIYTVEALERGEKILSEKITFLKTDLRILTNTMYNRF